MSRQSNEDIEAKKKENFLEDEKLKIILDEFEKCTLIKDGSIRLGKTPLSLSLAGANQSFDLYISPSTIIKIGAKNNEHRHAHNISKECMYSFLSELRNPVMIIKGSHKDSLVAVTTKKDTHEQIIIISVVLNAKEKHFIVNKITSAYGRRSFKTYIEKQLHLNHLIACNKKKANEMLQSLGLQSPPEETFISYDDSISYTTNNVNYPINKNSAEKNDPPYRTVW